MKSLVKKFAPQFVISLVSSIIQRTNGARFSISQFLEFASGEVRPSDRVLDAGAGSRLYKPYFVHALYESTDFSEKFSKPKDKHTFICDLHHIPVSDNSYDAIVNIQVLEHVEYPQKIINEFYRILKPTGRLFLTAPQGWKVHMAPYHFFNFTRYGLESLFKNAGFQVEFIKPKGGVFCYLANIIAKLPRYLFDEYRSRVSKPFIFMLDFIGNSEMAPKIPLKSRVFPSENLISNNVCYIPFMPYPFRSANLFSRCCFFTWTD